MEMLLAGCSKDERLQAWYQYTSWVERSCQKFVQGSFVVHSQSYTRLLLQYTSAMVAIVNLLNINGDVPGRMFKR